MGDEHLNTVPEKESDEFIKSSVENLVPIPGESQGTFDHMCDLPSPLECPKDQFETFSDLSDDCTSYGDIEVVEASLPHSDVDPLLEEFADELTHINPLPTGSDDDLLDFEADLGEIENLLYHDPSLTSYPDNPIENVDHFVSTTFNTTITNSLFEFDSEFTLNSVNPIFDSDESETETIMDEVHIYSPRSTAHVPPPYILHELESKNSNSITNSLHEKFSDGLTHIMTPPEYDGKKNLDRGERFLIMRICIDDKIPTLPPEMFSKPKSSTDKIQTSATALDPEEEDLVMIIIKIFLSFFTYKVTCPSLRSFGSEDTIFDPGISMYHSFEPDISHRCGTFTYFNVFPNILNESPMEIFFSTCSPMDQ